MKIRKLTNEEIKGACAFAVNIYNIAIRSSFRTQDCHRYFDEYMDADRLTDEERTGVLAVFGAFESNVLCGVCGMTNEGHITMLYVHPQYLRHGIGKKLLERVRIYARMQLKLMQVSVNAMPAYMADYFRRVGFKSAYQGGFCNGQSDMYVPMTAKSIYQIEYTPRRIADKTFIAISVGFTCLVFFSGVIYALCAGLTP
uniref:GNAT family N-acetyltransferase n=1 Tax=Agathobacter rectalis TaxID=39491 RepID=UPI004026DBC3